jgi:hypothetical protein
LHSDPDRTDDLPDRPVPRAAAPRYSQRLRRLAELWPSLDDEERQQLEVHLHRIREKATA